MGIQRLYFCALLTWGMVAGMVDYLARPLMIASFIYGLPATRADMVAGVVADHYLVRPRVW